MSMNRTRIEWTDYTWNPITGCLHGCDYCYAKKITQRFPKNYPNGFQPTFYPERLTEPLRVKKPSKIFTVSMGDMFGNWMKPQWVRKIIKTIADANWHQFQILTKDPLSASLMLDFLDSSDEGLPHLDNLWIGTSIVDADAAHRITDLPLKKPRSGLRFVSFEPLLSSMPSGLDFSYNDLDWVIIGAQTNPSRLPEDEWVQHIIDCARDEDIPIFLKNSIQRYWPEQIQEFPKVAI